eukprot:maker-scaffold299_size217019-snap-gene-1.28 protein:Tk09196 transcript:maker-scaffold299_size217019-snap-gene-1.28-mRNA-1 annotation:"---NA---"
MATITERVVPIKLEGASTPSSHGPSERPLKRRSLIVTHEDGSRDEIQGLVTKLSDSSENVHKSGVEIKEIGLDTLKKELRKSGLATPSKDSEADGFQTLKNSSESVRFVPIKMPDGRILARDPDETMEIKTEFTNYCHTEFADKECPTPRHGRARHKSSPSEQPSTPTRERIVPIQLDTGERFMPKFTKLDDLEPPEWSAFSPKYKPSSQTPNQSPAKSSLKPEFKEKIVPIRLDGIEPDGTPTKDRPKPSLSNRGSPLRSSVRSIDGKAKTKKPTEKRVHHTVRFNVDDDDDSSDDSPTSRKARSSSLDSRYRHVLPSNGTSATSLERTRHRSGGSTTEKTLHEIDRDITKIWRELQELETFPPAPTLNGKPPAGAASSTRSPYFAARSASPGLRNGSPVRRGQTAPVTPTPVKIRTYTTPGPLSSSVGSTSAPASRPSSPYLDAKVPSASVIPSASNGSVTVTSTPPPWRPASSLGPASPLTYKSPPPYNPRRDLEPTRPGYITPVVRKIPIPSSSGSQSGSLLSPGSLAGGKSTVTAAPASSSGSAAAPGPSQAVVAPSLSNGTGTTRTFNNNTTKISTSSSQTTSANRNSGVDFYPRMEQRPRENSLNRGREVEATDGEEIAALANGEDKSTQTDTIGGRIIRAVKKKAANWNACTGVGVSLEEAYLEDMRRQGVAFRIASIMLFTTLDGVGSSHFKSSVSTQCRMTSPFLEYNDIIKLSSILILLQYAGAHHGPDEHRYIPILN